MISFIFILNAIYQIVIGYRQPVFFASNISWNDDEPARSG